MIFWLLGLLCVLFGLVAFRGAPYVPTHKRQVGLVLDMLNLKPGQVLVDLGSGDGVMLLAAAKRGIVVYGYEINPILCLISYIRCWKYRHLVHVQWRDFWITPLPPQTAAVFTFLAKPYMNKFSKKIKKSVAEQKKDLYVVSYGFELPGFDAINYDSGLHLYKIQP